MKTATELLANEWLRKAETLGARAQHSENLASRQLWRQPEESDDVINEIEAQEMRSLADTLKTCAYQLLSAINRDNIKQSKKETKNTHEHYRNI